jgi:hypothetical protein
LAAWKTWKVEIRLFSSGDVWREGRARDSGQMDDGVDAAVDLVDAGEGLDDLAVVGEVGADEARSAVR